MNLRIRLSKIPFPGKLEFLATTKFLIVDEIGCLANFRGWWNLFFRLISRSILPGVKMVKKTVIRLLMMTTSLTSSYALAQGFAEGVPVTIQKTDYSSKHLIYIQLDKPISLATQCDSNNGLVVNDANESSKAALGLAMMALATGSRFRCYVTDQCSAITGALTTYPVCSYYPSLVK